MLTSHKLGEGLFLPSPPSFTTWNKRVSRSWLSRTGPLLVVIAVVSGFRSVKRNRLGKSPRRRRNAELCSCSSVLVTNGGAEGEQRATAPTWACWKRTNAGEREHEFVNEANSCRRGDLMNDSGGGGSSRTRERSPQQPPPAHPGEPKPFAGLAASLGCVKMQPGDPCVAAPG